VTPVSTKEEEPNLNSFDRYDVVQIRRRNVNKNNIVMSPERKTRSFAAELTSAFVE
jgi:hypothetical protein